jgi:uncharacterized membrane protein
MVTRPGQQDIGWRSSWDGEWLPAGILRLDHDHAATVAFNRDGEARLTVALDRPVRWTDLEALEQVAELLPHVRLSDLADADAYRQRHAAAFELPTPLPRARFNLASEIRLLAPAGGAPLPTHLSSLGVPTYLVEPDRHAEGEHTDGPGGVRPGGVRPGGVRPGGVRPGGVRPATTGTPHQPGFLDQVERAGLALTGALTAAERGVLRATRLSSRTLWPLLLGLAVAGFVGVFVWQTFSIHERFGSYGFDLGIFDQGTWLLSQVERPFVTIRGLNLFGDHASYILLLVAPLYRLWADPRLLLTLQVLALAFPAVVLYRIAARRLRHPAAGLAVALAYLAYPGMQWAATWQFHPETLAAGFLAGAALAADEERPRTMAVLLALAMLCKEDVGLVVAGFGALLWLTGRARWGQLAIAAGIGWFLLTAFVLVPLANGRGSSPHAQLNYGIGGSGPLAVLGAVPDLLQRALVTTFANTGLAYLALVFVPLALLPLASWRHLLPVAPPILLNLAAVHGYQQKITYQYLATSAPFLAIAATAGMVVLTARRRGLLAPLAILLVAVAVAMDVRFGPAPWSDKPALGPPPRQTEARQAALSMIPPDAPVSAQYHLVTHLAHRRQVYEFPNPFRAVNWGVDGDQHAPADAEAIRYVLVEPSLISESDQATLDDVRRSGTWRTAMDRDGVLLLERAERAP